MKRLTVILFAMVFAIGLTFENIPSIFAQEGATEEFTLEEITVTAQKREENSQKVAITMDVINTEDIQAYGKTDLDEILENVTGVLIQKASDGLRVSIRGMTDTGKPRSGQATSAPTVAINTDGVYTLRKDSGSSLYDIERVEVLYGPQSTMYSSNSPGGIVNIVTASPKTDEYSISGTIEYGNYELLHTEGAMNIPLDEKTAMRVSFTTQTRGSYMEGDEGTAEDTKSARIKTLYSPTDRIVITATAEHSKSGGQGYGGGVTAFIDQDDVDNPWNTDDVMEFLGANDHSANRLSANIKLDTDMGSITMVPSYSTRKGDNVNTMSQPEEGDDSTGTITTTMYQKQFAREKGVELRMASSSDFFIKWIAGANYYKSMDTQERASEDFHNDPTTGYWELMTMGQETRAFFANITYPIRDNLRMTAGYRQSWDTAITDSDSIYNDTGDTKVGGGAPEGNNGTNEMENDGRPDYKVGFEYDLAENSMLYGDYSTSYRVSNMEGGPDSSSDPEELNAYTVGAKNRFFGNKLQVNIAAYYYDYSNFSASNEVQTTIGGEIYRERASDQGNGYMIGVDLQASVIITQRDMLNLSASYVKSAWDDLYFDYDYAEDVDYHGVPMSFTPPWTLNLSYDHNFNLWNGGILKTGITSKFQNGYRLSWADYDMPYAYQESHHMENVNMSYTHSDGKWTLSGYINNVFNYAEKRFYLSSGGGGKGVGTLTISNPRTCGIVLSVKY